MIPPNIQAHIDGLLKDADGFEALANQCRQAAAILSSNFTPSLVHSVTTVRPEIVGDPEQRRTNTRVFALSTAPTKSRADLIEEIISEIGPCKTPALVAGLIARGQDGPKNDQVYITSVNNTLKRFRETRFVKLSDGSWDLRKNEPRDD